jgi:hypothetical protein
MPWRREKTCRCRELNTDRPARSPSLYRLSYPTPIFPVVREDKEDQEIQERNEGMITSVLELALVFVYLTSI